MALRSRLLRDIAELQRNPYPNISFTSCVEDFTKACLVLTTDHNRLHLTVDFPETYPLVAPKVTIQTPIDHPNIFGSYICASILNTTEGYTPAYDLKGICIQILSFFASDRIEQDYGEIVALSNYNNRRISGIPGNASRQVYAQIFECSKCDFARLPAVPRSTPGLDFQSSMNNSKRRRSKRPQISAGSVTTGVVLDRSVHKSQKILLSDLPDEILAVICEHLETEELPPFARAWSHIGGEEGIVNTFNIIRNREMICFCLKKPAGDVQLGIGVSIRRQGRIGSFESEFDLLSFQAFKDFGIRRSVQGLNFTHWMPLAITRRHYNSIKDTVPPHLKTLATAAGIETQQPFAILCAFMNDIVVRLCNQAESGYTQSSLVHASEKAIESYYHLFHLLLCLATEDDNSRRSANQTIKSFFVDGKTSKKEVPNLGHLLVAVLISDADMTDNLLLAIIRETVTRNVVWMLDKRGANMQELAYMESNTISQYRLQKTFDASKTSYRLLMFLNLFRKTINRGTGKDKKTLLQLREELFNAHGAPPRGTAARLAADIKALQNVKNFPEFIKIMGLTPPPASTFTTFLRECVEASVQKGYSIWAITQDKALILRQQKDPDVEIRDNVKPEWNSGSRGIFNPSFFPNPKNKKGGAGGNK